MNLDTLVDLMVTAVVSDSALNTWTLANYTNMVTVFKGVDLRNPPDPATDYPVVAFFPQQKTSGYQEEKRIHTIGVVCAIQDATLTTTEVAIDGFDDPASKKVYLGIANIEAMRALVLTAIEVVIPAGMFVDSLVDEYENIEIFPDFMIRETYEINEPYAQGAAADVLE